VLLAQHRLNARESDLSERLASRSQWGPPNREAFNVRGQPHIEIEQPVADAKQNAAEAEEAALRLVAGVIADRIEEMSRRQLEETFRDEENARQTG